jgi:hypothetical protein
VIANNTRSNESQFSHETVHLCDHMLFPLVKEMLHAGRFYCSSSGLSSFLSNSSRSHSFVHQRDGEPAGTTLRRERASVSRISPSVPTSRIIDARRLLLIVSFSRCREGVVAQRLQIFIPFPGLFSFFNFAFHCILGYKIHNIKILRGSWIKDLEYKSFKSRPTKHSFSLIYL